MISRFFIARPILANVIAMLFVLIGAVSVINLPVAQYPNVVPPTVTVTTTMIEVTPHGTKSLKSTALSQGQ